MADDAFEKEARRGPFGTYPATETIVVADVPVPPSRQPDPHLRVTNAKRSPQPYEDLRKKPNLTGTYFETEGRFNLFINHVGGHLEGLIALVSTEDYYQRVQNGRDLRLPDDWGIPEKEPHPKTLAYRFAGAWMEHGAYLLQIPRWIGRWVGAYPWEENYVAKYGGLPEYLVGSLESNSDGSKLTLVFEIPFWARWPTGLKVSFGEGSRVTTHAIRGDGQPVMLDRYLAHAGVPFHVRTAYWFRLTPQQVRAVPRFAHRIRTASVRVDKKTFLKRRDGEWVDIYDLLMAERELGMDWKDAPKRNVILTRISDIVADVFNRPHSVSVLDGGFGTSHYATLRSHVLGILDAWYLPSTEGHPKQSAGTALQRSLDRVDEDQADIGALKKYLGLGARGYRTFRYEVEFQTFKLLEFEDKETQQKYEDAKKAGDKLKKAIEDLLKKKSKVFARYKRVMKYLPGAYLAGWAKVSFKGVVEYADPADENGREDPPWVAEYGFILLGLKANKSWGDSLKIKKGVAHVRASTPPNKEDLEGILFYGQGDAFSGIDITSKDAQKGLKGSYGGKLGGTKSMLSFFGSSQEPVVTFWLDGELGENTEGAAVGFKTLLGDAWLLAGTRSDITLAPDEKDKSFDEYWGKRIARLAVHFPINGARLPIPTVEEDEKMHAFGTLGIREALDAFAACELPLLAHPNASVRIDGYADAPGKPKKNLELSLNRATSIYNYLRSIMGDQLTLSMPQNELEGIGRLALAAHGEPNPHKDDGRIREEFDPNERRADLEVWLRDDPDGKVEPDDEAASVIELLEPRET